MIPKKDCKTCGGVGQIPDVGVEPQCCGQWDDQGNCCNNPEPVQVVYGSQECPECEAWNELIDEQINGA